MKPLPKVLKQLNDEHYHDIEEHIATCAGCGTLIYANDQFVIIDHVCYCTLQCAHAADERAEQYYSTLADNEYEHTQHMLYDGMQEIAVRPSEY